MQQIVHRPTFGSVVRIADGSRERASAAVVRHASTRVAVDADALTIGQHIARWGMTAIAIVLASAFFAFQIHATLH